MKNQNPKLKKTILFSVITMTTFLGLAFAPILTLAAEPVSVNTLGAENIEIRAANLRGSVLNDGGYPKMTVWFEYGPTAVYGFKTQTRERSGPGDFSVRATNLAPGITYHFRAVARNSAGATAYGSDRAFGTLRTSFLAQNEVQNLTLGDTVWYTDLRVRPGDFLRYRITLKSTADVVLTDIMVNSQLPNNIVYKGNLFIKDTANLGDISRGSINAGNLLPGDSKIITFEAEVGPKEQFPYSQNVLSNVVLAYNGDFSAEGRCQVVVLNDNGIVLASYTPTDVSTGISDSIFQSLLFPLLAAGLLVWLFRSRLLGLEQWAQVRREKTEQFRASKKLQQKINAAKSNF